jgi:TrbL/VirB6 plasmid conjugal transfer protein
MEGTFDVLGVLIQFLQGAMQQTAQIGLQLALGLATLAFLLRVAIAIAGGASGITGAAVHYLIMGGLYGTFLSGWPAIVNILFQSVQDLSAVISGSALNPIATAERGFDLFLRTLDQGFSWALLLPQNLVAAGLLPFVGFGVFLIWLVMALTVAAAIFLFFASAVIAPVLMGLLAIPPLAGFGASAIGAVLSSTAYLAILSVIISAGEALFNASVPGPDETVTLTTLGNAAVSALVVLWLGIKASNYAATITRGASGGTGISGLVMTAAGFGLSRAPGAAAAGTTIASRSGGGAVVAGGGGGGSAAAGAGGGGGAAAGGAAAAGGGGGGFGGGGSFGSAAGSVGRSVTP